MEKRIHSIVSEKNEGIRLETFLKNSFHMTKNEISRAKFREDGICVNGERRRVSALLHAGDLAEVLLETEKEVSDRLPSSDRAVSVLYEDEDVIVLDKPAGISVHPPGPSDQDTLANRLAFYLREKGEDSVIRISGRLDKDTSGAVLATKNRASAARLASQKTNKQFFKDYLAIAKGRPDPPDGIIDLPLGTAPGQKNRMCTDPAGKYALTRYETLETKNRLSFVRLRLETGRMHQIRVHMASIGCPLLGDPLYGKGPALSMERTALHAGRLCFLQPFTGRPVQITAPLPEDMRELFTFRFLT